MRSPLLGTTSHLGQFTSWPPSTVSCLLCSSAPRANLCDTDPPPVIKPGMHGSNAPPALTFDRFVRCCVSVRHLTEGELSSQRVAELN